MVIWKCKILISWFWFRLSIATKAWGIHAMNIILNLSSPFFTFFESSLDYCMSKSGTCEILWNWIITCCLKLFEIYVFNRLWRHLLRIDHTPWSPRRKFNGDSWPRKNKHIILHLLKTTQKIYLRNLHIL